MKILFIDESLNLQEKWIEPLRGEGWGVVRARSTIDAEKIFEFHGDSLSALVVSESCAAWAEKWNYPYIVFIKTWKEHQVLKHQNSSSHPAIAYLNFDSNIELVKQAIGGTKNEAQENVLPVTGTSALAPEITFEKYSEQKIEIESTSLKDSDRTMMLHTASMADLNLQPEFMAKSEEVNEENLFEDEQIIEDEQTEEEKLIESETSFSASEIPAIFDEAHFTPGNKDLETMKNYLSLREQDVALLTGQMRSTQERVQQLEMLLKIEKARSGELQHLVQKQEQQIKNFDQDKRVEFEVLYQQVEDANLQLRERTDKARTIEAKLKITTDEVEKIKERVRVDIRRIRVREKELESQLEILKKDSTALLVARDEKIIELKRKIDLLEFNMELVQEQYGKERNQSEQLRHKLKEAAGVMKRAGGLLEHEN